jgi:biotin carboxyl carrier protein
VGVGTDGDGLVLNVWGADPGEAGGGVDARVGLARRWARTSANASSDPSSSPAAAPALSPMPGRVVKLCVGVGDAVARGDPVAVLEAMKMEHAVLAPCDGVVSAVGVGVGSLVATGEEIVWVGGGEGGAAAAEVGGGY